MILKSYALQHEVFKIINLKDCDDSVPLHYAVKMWPQNIIKELLERGALVSVGVKNNVHEQPLNKLKSEVVLPRLFS